jgi:MoaA/NifB/PqqE/SkfB family radical SAM enzyme
MFRNIVYSEIFRPSELGIILSYQCNAGCKHCLYACSRKWSDWMTNEQLAEALDVLAGWRHDYQVHHTGGEPFMNFPFLLEAVKLTRDRGMTQFVETNAMWCVSKDRAHDWLKQLAEAGLDSILISCSPFQSEKIPLRRVLLAVEAAGEIFGYGNVGVYQTQFIQEMSKFGVDETVSIEDYVERYGEERAGQIFWNIYGLIDSGRASYTLAHLTRRHPPESFRRYNCRRELLYAHHSHFDLYGNYISWFCGGLRMGDWRDFIGMVDRYERGDYPELTGILINDGPYGLCRFACDKYGYSTMEDDYVGKCHLCLDVRKHLSAQGEFDELQPAQFYDFIGAQA